MGAKESQVEDIFFLKGLQVLELELNLEGAV
jgi:hypothetical protein